MDKAFHVSVPMADKTYQSMARVQLKELAAQSGFTGHRLGEIEIIIAELTSNISKHTSDGGHILCLVGPDKKSPCIEFISIDKGPGMGIPLNMLKDGVSTKKTLGHGLGAIKRLSQEFDIYSKPGWGTIVFSRNYKTEKKQTHPMHAEVLRVPKDGEIECGDNWYFSNTTKSVKLAVADGLGHGPEASVAATSAVNALAKLKTGPLEGQLREIHTSIKKTRGAVMSVINIDVVNRQAAFCGVGNITCKIIPENGVGKGRTCNPYNGILGHSMPGSISTSFSHMDAKLDMVIMHSDGLSSRWDLAQYPAINDHHPMILCAALYKDFSRGNDDSTVAVLRQLESV